MFPQWRIANRFNKYCVDNNNNIQYILLLPTTKRFVLEEDLQRLLKRKYKLFQFNEYFKKLQCVLFYFTLFTDKQNKITGPIAKETSNKICTIILQKKLKHLNSNVRIVGPTYLKQKFDILTYDEFVQIINKIQEIY